MKNDTYEDIINLPHHESLKHPQMSKQARAAQFAPFAALTGYSEAIKETTRQTDKKIDIDESLKNLLNNKLKIILENIKDKPEITFTYFVYDNRKSGGKYISTIGNVKKIDMIEKYIMLVNKVKIPINEIINITGDLFKKYED